MSKKIEKLIEKNLWASELPFISDFQLSEALPALATVIVSLPQIKSLVADSEMLDWMLGQACVVLGRAEPIVEVQFRNPLLID